MHSKAASGKKDGSQYVDEHVQNSVPVPHELAIACVKDTEATSGWRASKAHDEKHQIDQKNDSRGDSASDNSLPPSVIVLLGWQTRTTM